MVPFVHISDMEAVVRDVWNEDLWDFSCIQTPLPNCAKQSIASLPIPSHVNLDDGWVWLSSSSGIYPSANGYHWLLSHNKNCLNWMIGPGFGGSGLLRRFVYSFGY